MTLQATPRVHASPARRIAAIQGAPSRLIQDLMKRAVLRWTEAGARIAGLVEFHDGARSGRHATRLINLTTGATYPLFQDLGPMAAACHLDGSWLVEACAAIRGEIDRGCDLVVLSKFGQLEAMRSGLMDAFAAAVERDIPILTAVSPAYQDAWHLFSAPLGSFLPADDGALDRWWRSASGRPRR